MTVFLSGGCKNGKSTLAEQTAVYLSRPGQLYYLATMIPHDEEDRSRIARHVASRSGLGFQTIEGGLGLEARQKLAAIRPLNIGQASRISGVTPADVSVILVYLEQLKYSNPDLFYQLNSSED